MINKIDVTKETKKRLSIQIPLDIAESDLSIYEKMVFGILFFRCYSGQEQVCWPSQEGIARLASMSTREVRRSLKSLEEKGYIEKKRREGTTNIYVLNFEKIDNPKKETQEEKPKKENPEKSKKTKAVIMLWCELFQKRWGKKYLFAGGKDGAAAKRLSQFELNDLEELIVWAWEAKPVKEDRFLATASKTLSGFSSVVNQLIALKNDTKDEQADLAVKIFYEAGKRFLCQIPPKEREELRLKLWVEKGAKTT